MLPELKSRCMKLAPNIVLLCLCLCAAAFAPNLFASPGCVCFLQWDASGSPEVTGYDVYYGVSGSSVTNEINVGDGLSANITGLAASTTYFFYVVDYDAYGDQSPPSNVLLFTTPPISSLQLTAQANGLLSIQFLVSPGAACSVEYTPTLSPPAWTVLTNVVAGTSGLVTVQDLMSPSNTGRFYRGVTP